MSKNIINRNDGLTNYSQYSMKKIKKIIKDLPNHPDFISKISDKLNTKMSTPLKISLKKTETDSIAKMIRASYPNESSEMDTLYKAHKHSVKIADEENLDGVLTEYNIRKLVENGVLDGSIETDDQDRIQSSSINLEQVKAWTIILGAFESMVESKIATQSGKSNQYSINISDNRRGATVSENKIQGFIKGAELMKKALPAEKHKEIGRILGFDN